MTSPEPSLDCYDAYGRPVFADEIRTPEELKEIAYVQQLIADYTLQFLQTFYNGQPVRPQLCNKLYGADKYHYVFQYGYDDWGQVMLSEAPDDSRTS